MGLIRSLVVLAAARCGGGAPPRTAPPVSCEANVDPPVPRNAPLRTVQLEVPEGTQLRVANNLSFVVDILWATRDQLYPYPIDRLRTEALNLGRALPGNPLLPVPTDLPDGTFYKLRAEPLAGPGGRPVWSLAAQQWRSIHLRLVCP